MCLIIASPDGKLPDADVIRRAGQQNPHGFGVTFADGRKIHTAKTMAFDEATHTAMLDAAAGKPFLAHWRMATSGRKDLATAHPFIIGSHVALAHNGIIPRLGGASSSDTMQLVDLIKSRLGGVVSIDTVFAELVRWTGVLGDNGKYALLDASGQFRLLNEDEGSWIGGMWYSNESCTRSFSFHDDGGYGFAYGNEKRKSRGNLKTAKPVKLLTQTDTVPVYSSEADEYDAGYRAGLAEGRNMAGTSSYGNDGQSDLWREGYTDGYLESHEIPSVYGDCAEDYYGGR